MKNQETCSFYVSDAHLLTIILPYINEKINEGKNVKIISENDLSEEVKKYLKSVKNFDGENLKKICWKGKNDYKNLDENTVVFIIGSKDFIDSTSFEDERIEIIRCYKIENINLIKYVIEDYDYYLRTDGKLKIIKNSQNEQNSNTIKSQL